MTILDYYYIVMSSDEPSTSSKPSTSSEQLTLSEGRCAVCGDSASGKRYGSWSCLGCIVFFRRTVLRNMKYRCQKNGMCEISVETRCVCRSCRMEKCLAVGMNPEAIQIRDVIGPRKPKSQTSSTVTRLSRSSGSPLTPFLPSQPSTPPSFFPPNIQGDELDQNLNMDQFLELQKVQRENHQNYCGEEEYKFSEGCVFMKNDYHRCATSSDINLALKLAMEDSNSFASRFEFYRNLSADQKIKILSEFSIGFMLLDQGMKTRDEADDGFWLLQNGSFLALHPDFKFEAEMMDEEKEMKEKCHFDFVTQLLDTISKSMRDLKLDDFECAILKILLLLTPSSTSDNKDRIRNNFMKILMDHVFSKSAENGSERFGEILLLIGSVRCAVKSFYNITKVCDLFDVRNFDQSVRDVLVE